jgi:hypothetical protein
MCAVVVISIMFGAVIVMVKKADKEMTSMRISGSSIRVRPNPNPRTGKVTEGHVRRLKTHQTLATVAEPEKSLRQPTRQKGAVT